MAKINIGDIAPDFTLSDHTGKIISLSDFRNKNAVVLIFYPGDSTPLCTKQMCAARDDFDRYEQAGVKVFGVNQAGEGSHRKFVSRFALNTPLLVDHGLEVSKQYDAVFGLGPVKVINRTVVGIDTEGKIAFYQRGVPSTDQILAALTTSQKEVKIAS
jgi:peroxiredoxin Q/BCP